ncbi:MAG: ankyrin repeat domain-containing protein [Proteobacteria bacterium]|nr:ankyrin repeat domain-containing protein [Pseudomonadota bacterium]NBP14886.1 ankyrin repeat domain-containing protein [bacterium]
MKRFMYILLFSFSNFIESAQDGEPPAKVARVDDPRVLKLVAAVRENDFATMEKLLKDGVSIFTKTPERGSCLLNPAIGNGHKEIFYYLVRNGLADHLNYQNSEGVTPFMLAAQEGYPDVVKFMLKKGGVDGLVTTASNNGSTALLLAVLNRKIDVVQLLIEHQACVNTGGGELKTTPLMVASNNADKAMVKLLLNHQAQVNKQRDLGDTALIFAVQKGNFPIVKLLLEHGADPLLANNYGLTGFMIACREGYFKIAQLLFDHNPGIVNLETTNKETALFYAAYRGHTAIVEWLLKNGSDIHKGLKNNNLHTPLYVAAFMGHLPVIKVIENFLNQRNKSIIYLRNFQDVINNAYHKGENNIVVYLAKRVKKAGLRIPVYLQCVIDAENMIFSVSSEIQHM